MAWSQSQGQPAAAECLHIHFKTNVIDRDILTKRQHLNLLCTPRGYRWEIFAIKEEEGLVCSSKPRGKPKRSEVYNLLGELWSIVTPEMVEKLQQMMVTEFGLSAEEARDFVCKQMKEMVNAMGKRGNDTEMSAQGQPFPAFIYKGVQGSELAECRYRMPVKLKPRIVKKVTHALASKLAEMAMYMMHGKRGHKQRRMSEVLFNGICQISGETFNPEKPRNKLHKLQLFLADKLGMWLAENIVDERLELTRKRKIEDEVIKNNSLKRAKEYEKKVRERAALARKITIQKKVAEEKEKEAKRKEEEKKKQIEESRKKKMEEWTKKEEARKKRAEAKRSKDRGKKSDKGKKTDVQKTKMGEAKNKQGESKKKQETTKMKRDEAKKKNDAAGLVGDIITKAEKKQSDTKKEQKKKSNNPK